MITLTNPIQVPNSLGGTTFTAYNKIRIVSISADPFSLTINAQIQLMVSSDPNQPTITGNLTIIATGATPIVTIEIPTLNFFKTLVLTGAAVTTVQGWITSLQNSIESGLIAQGLVAGAQSAGT